MFLKRFGIVLFLCVLLVFPVFASTVSFLVVETGIPHSANAGDFAFLWEGGLMGAFFDAGHIVSNSPVLRIENPPPAVFQGPEIPREALVDFSDALEGGADYFVIAMIEFISGNGRVIPMEISVRIFNTVTQAIIYEDKFQAGSGTNPRDEFMNAQDAGKIIAAQIR